MGKNKRSKKGAAQGKGKHKKSTFIAEQRTGVIPYVVTRHAQRLANTQSVGSIRSKVTKRKVA